MDDTTTGSDGGAAAPTAHDRAHDPAPRGDWRARLRGSRFGTLAVLIVTAVAVLAGTWAVQHPTDDTRVAVGGEQRDGVTAVKLDKEAAAAPVVGSRAPEFAAATIEGKPVSLRELRGRPVWLTFGATWCAGCRSEFPDIQDTVAKHAGKGDTGPAVVAVYLSEDASTVKGYADKLGLTFAHVPDPRTEIASEYGVMGVPAHFFIDSQGVVRGTKVGALTPEQMEAQLATLK